jgi:quercetin dioxygenase-like cupin family protein
MTNSTTLHLSKDEGAPDLWWPYGPSVGRYTIKTTAEQTRGSLIQMLIHESRGAAVPRHVHYDVDETFYLIDGELTAYIGDEVIEAKSGDFVLAPRGVPHSWIVTSETCELFLTCGPAGQEDESGSGIAGFFLEVADRVGDGEKPDPRMPDNELFGRRMLAYGIELLGPPPSLD